jgi:peptide methionine sulfoxide reductase MsrA
MYFAVGCFWHVQHTFILAEGWLLNRTQDSYTALAGYAGAKNQVQACYYDGQVTAEVVGLTIPSNYVKQFADVYFKLFAGHDRSHSGDKGPHYRAVLGLPGGLNSPLMTTIQEAETANGKSFDWKAGQGDDGDTLYDNTIWVYDSDTYLFHQAEMYHQFHDDYLPTGYYPQSYNNLMAVFACAKKIVPTGCSRDGQSALDAIDCTNEEANDDAQRPAGSGPLNDMADAGDSSNAEVSAEPSGNSSVHAPAVSSPPVSETTGSPGSDTTEGGSSPASASSALKASAFLLAVCPAGIFL